MLLTNGCSFVWGDELEGYDQSPPAHNHHTFTHKLANKLGVEYVNLATCGACNSKIFRDTMHYLRNCDKYPTHMVILWSAFQRGEIAENHSDDFEVVRKIQRWQCMTQISPSRLHNLKPALAETLVPFYEHNDVLRAGILETLSRMCDMQWLCDTLGIKLIQGTFHRRAHFNLSHTLKPVYRRGDANWSPWMDYIIEILDELKPTSRIGLGHWIDLFSLAERDFSIKPYGHPDENSQTEYASILHHIFETSFE